MKVRGRCGMRRAVPKIARISREDGRMAWGEAVGLLVSPVSGRSLLSWCFESRLLRRQPLAARARQSWMTPESTANGAVSDH